MLLSETKHESYRIAYFDSSNILVGNYNTKSKELLVVFKKGRRYTYQDVPESVFDTFCEHTSQGKAFNKLISKEYTYQKVDDVDPTEILDYITELKQQTL